MIKWEHFQHWIKSTYKLHTKTVIIIRIKWRFRLTHQNCLKRLKRKWTNRQEIWYVNNKHKFEWNGKKKKKEIETFSYLDLYTSAFKSFPSNSIHGKHLTSFHFVFIHLLFMKIENLKFIWHPTNEWLKESERAQDMERNEKRFMIWLEEIVSTIRWHTHIHTH